MKASEGEVGRIFIIRLEDGDVVPDCIERFAADKQVTAGFALMVGGIGGGQVVVGPRLTKLEKPEAMFLPVDGAHEVVAVGTLAPDAGGKPVLHMHGALGRAGQTMTGCLRPGVTTWLIAEVILLEIRGAAVARLPDAASGFDLLKILR